MRWGYRGGRRDLRLDLLRGLAVIMMVADHVGGQQSWLYTITGGDRFFISAAEGFVFISGLVMGIVYVKLVATKGLEAAIFKALRRAWTLYGLTVTLTLTWAAISVAMDLPWKPEITRLDATGFVIGVLTLHRSFYLTDVLLLYTLLVLAAIPMLAILARGRTWPVLALSWGLWALWQHFPEQARFPWAVTDNSVFQFSAWQVLFLTGLVIGYRRERIERLLAGWSRLLTLGVSGMLAAASIVLYRTRYEVLQALWPRSDPDQILDHVFGKADVRAGRLVVFAIFAVFTYTLLTLSWVPVERALGRLLLPLGQNALGAYVVHLFAVGLVTHSGWRLFGFGPRTKLDNTASQALAIGLVWLAVTVGPGALEQCRRGARLALAAVGNSASPGGERTGWHSLGSWGLRDGW
jgi:hypothetical protein